MFDEIISDAQKLLANPNVQNVLHDAVVAVELLRKLEEGLKGKHPSMWDIVTVLYKLRNSGVNK